ncbi:uncharacterized protein TRUGW13939_01358 [Talaromyces rugulosus]|uniref:Enoyl reductase (ER) domain-containing protein n=1 Tax=Talaromyces rugulosus TaxID=121627 RepID=A0A7H8QM69_TALRU|nr:uncharacterized protein TRUGW13939_01358 [Talaromyces rugulosus]QKX54273.1 hypothetical protein TRUGW13939_01358 [Talaromyces rugulosus]
MKAVVIHETGGPEVLKLEQRAVPQAEAGQVLIRVKSFGLNRAEMYSRQGFSPNLTFPRILGLEATGIVEAAPGGEFAKGQVVMTAMGDMGRGCDGGYAQYTVVPVNQVQAITVPTKLGWDVLGALPEMLQVAYGVLTRSLDVKKGERLLIRGGTTSIGLTAASIATACLGAHVTATSRRADREEIICEYGADEFLLDNGKIAEHITDESQKFDKALELVGPVTLKDTLKCLKKNATVSIAGRVGNSWVIKELDILRDIPYGTKLTTYGGFTEEFMSTPLNSLISQIEAGSLKVKIGKVFHIDQIVEAHRCMDEGAAQGKVVVLTD